VTRSGDTLKGIIKIRDQIRNQNKIRFYDKYNNKTVYRPFELIGYSFEAEYTTLDTIERYNQRPKIRWNKVRYLENYETKNWPVNPIFLLRLENGYVKLYEWFLPQAHYRVYDKKTGQSYRIRYSSVLIQKGNENLIITDSWGRKFKKYKYNASEYFSDYDALAAKILNSNDRVDYLETIVAEYNRWYKEKNNEALDTLKTFIQQRIDTLKSTVLSQEQKKTLREKPNQLVIVERDKNYFEYFCTDYLTSILQRYMDTKHRRGLTPICRYGNEDFYGWKRISKIISSINDQEATQLFKESKRAHMFGLTIAYIGYYMLIYSAVEVLYALDPTVEAPLLIPAVPALIISGGVFTFGIIKLNLGQKKLNKSVERYNYVISHRN
ncbi:MAG: hypothetical protein IIA88_03580, partial [Bacteroidetes bacterium]|nr:hypothetical protein [Bacteroidota bacterium]